MDDRRILDLRRRQRAAVRWHLVTVRRLRPVAVAAVGFAALLPFVAHAWGDGGGLDGAPAAFAASAASGPGAAGLVLAALCAGVLARRAARVGGVEGAVELVVYAFLGGMAGLAIARGALGL